MKRWIPKLKNIMINIIFISIIIIRLRWILFCFNNSINISLTIIAIAVLISIIFNIILSSWYRLILFLIYIGGIIVIFSYFVRLSSNESITLKKVYAWWKLTASWRSFRTKRCSQLWNASFKPSARVISEWQGWRWDVNWYIDGLYGCQIHQMTATN